MYGPDPYFGPQHLPDPREESVAWIDIMGTATIMNWSPQTASTNICKLITAVIEAERPENLNIYPMMDGVYLTHPDEEELAAVFVEVFGRFANVLRNRYQEYQSKNRYSDDDYLRFSPILRAGIARGDVYHGVDIEQEPLDDHHLNDDVLLGDPVARAHQAERSSPPFGFKLDDSVEDEYAGEIVEWWSDDEFAIDVKNGLTEYFEYHQGRPELNVSDAKIDQHLEQVQDFFPST